MPLQQQEKPTKQQLGAYYTPRLLAQLLTDWAVRKPTDNILDPSFGGCAFLCAGLSTLQERGAVAPGRQVFGVDVNADVEAHLFPLYEAGARAEQYIISDFFAVEQWQNGLLFDCITGNPPYINYHEIKSEDQARAVKRLEEAGFAISGRSSYWAYFLLHALRFLADGGRMAMILPGSFARADYANDLRVLLTSHFKYATLFFLQERVFEDTEEQAVVFLADGFRKDCGHCQFSVHEVPTVSDMALYLAETTFSQVDKRFVEAGSNLYHSLVSSEVMGLLQQLQLEASIIQLGQWVDVRIGVVTGSNRFFVMTPSQRERLNIPPEYVIPVLKKSRQIAGLDFTAEDAEALREGDQNCLLLVVDDVDLFSGAICELPDAVRAYLDNAPEKVKQASKCKERTPWYSLRHRYSPPAFFQYMSSNWPRIIINSSSATCLNNIHRLRWTTDRPPEDWERLATGSLSSLSQLSAELTGRSYGGGVLKLEPKEVVNVLVPLGVQANKQLAQEVDILLRDGKTEQATDLVDSEVLSKGLRLSKKDVSYIREAKNFLRSRRQKG